MYEVEILVEAQRDGNPSWSGPNQYLVYPSLYNLFFYDLAQDFSVPKKNYYTSSNGLNTKGSQPAGISAMYAE